MQNKIGLGQKKDLNAEINLTPFIDLLSTCVCFLLITAVWIQIGTIEVKQSYGTEAASVTKETYELDLVFKNPQEARLNLKKGGRRVKTYKARGEKYEDLLASMQSILTTKILALKKGKIEISSATVTPRSSIDYGKLIEALDVLRKQKIVNIGVLTARGQ